MRITICLAGLSSRFREAGFERPKYELELAGVPILERVLAGFIHADKDVKFTLISLRSNHLRDFINKTPSLLRRSRNTEIDVVEMPELTAGQAETVALALQHTRVCIEEPLIVFNGDTIYRQWHQPPAIVQLSEGYLDVTHESGNHWSFARLSDESNRLSNVVETTEKHRISNNCCTGLYAFRSGTQYLQIFDNFYRAGRSKHSLPSELFIAPMYNSILKIGKGVRIQDIDRKNVVFVGTPQEYQRAQDRWEWD